MREQTFVKIEKILAILLIVCFLVSVTSATVSATNVSVLPIANFNTGGINGGYSPFTVQFTDLSENVTEWYWDFGDGTNSTEQNPMHTYSSAGKFTVNLTASNGQSADFKLAIVDVLEKPVMPIANFSIDVTTWQFTDLSENATEWDWDFGDGIHSTERNPTHYYSFYGNYFRYWPYVNYDPEYWYWVPSSDLRVTLYVYNENGTDIKSEKINIPPPPESETNSVHFLSFPNENNPLSVQFMDTSTNNPEVYNWYFGDGTTSNEQNPLHTYSTPGNYTVTLVVAGITVGEVSEVISVQGLNVPVADFSVSPSSGIEPLKVRFTDTSFGDPISQYWDFGDGTNSTEQNPTHTYSSAGNYTVNLTVTNEKGVNSKYATITVPTAAPIYYSGNGHYYEVVSVPGITWEDAKNAAQSLSFSGMNGHLATITSQDENDFIINNIADDNCWWLGGFQPDDTQDSMEPDGNWHWVTEEKWDYTNWPIGRPDNAFSGQNRLALWSEKNWDDASSNDRDHIIGYIVEYEITAPIYNPENGHYYEVKNMPEGITWKDANNASESLSYLGMKGHLATIDSEYENEFIINNLHPNYHWLGGFQPDGSAEPSGGWQWVTGEPWDYTNWDSPEPNEYGNSGEDRLQIYANGYWNDISHSALNTGGYIVEYEEQRLPVANFSADVTKGNVPLSVQFTDLSENATQWNWDFGDGINSIDQNPTHTYSIQGNYTVTLTVSNSGGIDNVTKRDYIIVSKSEEAIIWGVAPLSLQFIDQSENATSWKWYFGDGTNSTEQNPTHTYTKAGQYAVTVTVNNMAGSNTATYSGYINVVNSLEPPIAAFSASPSYGKMPLNVSFTDKSTGSPNSWKWNFGDGTNSTEQNPTHTYNKTGQYSVTLTASNVAGSNAITKLNYISVGNSLKAPVTSFSVSVTS